jgi:isoquinoline 1-oxidoreductase subunit beta
MSAEMRDHLPDPTRRAALVGVAAAGTAFLFGFRVPTAIAGPEAQGSSTRRFEPNAFIRIDQLGTVTLVMPQTEMGQGIYTAVAMILAEELDVPFEGIALEAAPPNDKLYANPSFGIQVTGNSNSIRVFWMPLRKAGAGARAILIEAAARGWKVDSSTCQTEPGEVIHNATGRRIAYKALIGSTAGIAAPKDPPLKSVDTFRLIGRPLKRLDTPEKVNGKLVYGIDVMPPNVKFATLTACPVFGGRVGRVDEGAALKAWGVRQVVVLDDFVAVVGDNMWAATQGLKALSIEWQSGPHETLSTPDIWKQTRTASEQEGVVAKTVGDAPRALSQGGDRLDADYELPFLAHATMEPLNCTVDVRPDSCELWVGSQVISRAQAVAAKVTGFPLQSVVVHNLLMGGGFGRRLEVDHIEKAVRIAQKVEGPVKVVWSREEDIQHDIYRPVYRDKLSATLKDGRIAAWNYRITGSSILARWLPPAFQKGIDIDAVDGAIGVPYDIPNLRIEYVRDEPPAVPTGFWRGVGPNNNVFAVEGFVDELAKKAGQDPVAFRRAHLAKAPRLKAALELVASKSDWGQPVDARSGGRTGRGVEVQNAFGTFIATVAEVEVDRYGEVRVHRVILAIDTGIVVNPDTVIAQMQGGLIFGTTAALYGEITIKNGRVQQSNFHDYRMLRMDQTPEIQVHIIKSAESPGGIGETGTTAAPPALRNAIFAATGIPLRRLPFDRDVLAGRKTNPVAS